jgi:hypothetical protein
MIIRPANLVKISCSEPRYRMFDLDKLMMAAIVGVVIGLLFFMVKASADEKHNGIPSLHRMHAR